MPTHAYGLLSDAPAMLPLLAALATAQSDADLRPFMVERAVLFTDLSGFSAHPVLATALGRVLQMEVALQAMVPAAEGQVLKALGDSHLCLFPRVAQAVDAVERLQTLLLPANPFCAGIGWGPVLLCPHAQGRLDCFSVEVSGASRLGEDIATGTQCLLTDAAYRHLPPSLARRCRPCLRSQLPCWEWQPGRGA